MCERLIYKILRTQYGDYLYNDYSKFFKVLGTPLDFNIRDFFTDLILCPPQISI